MTTRIVSGAKAAAFIVLAWVVFGALGELATFSIWTLAPESPTLYAALVVIGHLAALACVAAAILVRRSGSRPSAFTRFALAGFAAFFCSRLIVFGLPDWSPLPLLGGVAWCWACGLCVLWLSRTRQESAEAEPAAA